MFVLRGLCKFPYFRLPATEVTYFESIRACTVHTLCTAVVLECLMAFLKPSEILSAVNSGVLVMYSYWITITRIFTFLFRAVYVRLEPRSCFFLFDAIT